MTLYSTGHTKILAILVELTEINGVFIHCTKCLFIPDPRIHACLKFGAPGSIFKLDDRPCAVFGELRIAVPFLFTRR